MDWLAGVENPIAMTVVIAFLFVSSILVLVRQKADQTGKLVDKFLDRADSQSEKLTEVVTSNTVAFEKHTYTIDRLTEAVERICVKKDD